MRVSLFHPQTKTISEDELRRRIPRRRIAPRRRTPPRRRMPRRRIAPRKRSPPQRRIPKTNSPKTTCAPKTNFPPEDELRPEDEFPPEDELRTPKTNYTFPRRNLPRRQISKTNSPKTNCVPNASRRRMSDELRRRIPRPKTHSEDEFIRIPRRRIAIRRRIPPKGEDEFPEDDLRPEDKLPPRRRIAKTISSETNCGSRRPLLPRKTNCDDELRPEDEFPPEYILRRRIP